MLVKYLYNFNLFNLLGYLVIHDLDFNSYKYLVAICFQCVCLIIN